jgi:hypothetical protein
LTHRWTFALCFDNQGASILRVSAVTGSVDLEAFVSR